MNLLAVLFGFLFVGDVFGVEEDTSYECLKNAIEKMSNSSCPLITPEVEQNREEYARLYTACTKGHFLINGCNETKWVHACTRRIANIPSSSRRYNEDSDLMWKACNEGVKDPDFECFAAIANARKNDTCPELTTKASDSYDIKTRAIIKLDCIKKIYEQKGCNKNEWIRVCNKQIDRLKGNSHISQDAIDATRLFCEEKHKKPSYKCLESAIELMYDNSCTEVTYAKKQNETAEEIMRHEISCLKRHYLHHDCEIADWKEVCKIESFAVKKESDVVIMQSFCNL